MHHSLSDLLYYDLSEKKKGILEKRLQQYKLLIITLSNCIEAMESGDLEKFDSLVGENACQIRAIRIAMIHSSYTPKEDLKKQINQTLNKISNLLTDQMNFLLRNKYSLNEVISIYQLDIPLSTDEKFALMSFFLNQSKESCAPSSFSLTEQEKCSPTKLKEINPEVSNGFTKKLANHLRPKLAKASVEFVQKTASHLQDPSLQYMLSDNFKYQHNDLDCLPIFWSCKALFQSALINNVPIIAHVKFMTQNKEEHVITDEKHFFFNPSKDQNGNIFYKHTTPSQDDLLKAACVVQGVAPADFSWNQESLTNSILDVILASAASHRQYPNPNHTVDVEDLEYSEFQSIAEDKGFSLNNPKTFFVQHIYTSQVSKKIPDAAIALSF